MLPTLRWTSPSNCTLVYIVLHHRPQSHESAATLISTHNVARTLRITSTLAAADREAATFVKHRAKTLAVSDRDITFKQQGHRKIRDLEYSAEEDWWESWELKVREQLQRLIEEGRLPVDMERWIEKRKVVGRELVWVERQWMSTEG